MEILAGTYAPSGSSETARLAATNRSQPQKVAARAQTQTPQAVATPRPSANAQTSVDPVLPTGSLFDALDTVLDLSSQGRDLLAAYSSLSSADQEAFTQTLSSLLSQGVVGTETLEVRGEPYTSFATTRIGDEDLRGARPYPQQTGITPRLDVQA